MRPALFFLVLCYLSSPFQAFSQMVIEQTGTPLIPRDSSSNHLRYQSYGFIAGTSVAQDQNLSNQRYSGWGIGLHQGEVNFRPSRYTEFYFQGAYDRLHSANDLLVHQIHGRLQYRHLFRLAEPKYAGIFLGPYTMINADFRLNDELSNNQEQWNYSTSLGASLRWQWTNLGKNWQLEHQCHAGLVGYMNRPNFGLPNQGSNHFFSFPGAWNEWGLSTSVLVPASKHNNNLYRISYYWQMIHHRDNDIQQMVVARHMIAFNFMFNTKKSIP